MLIIDTTVLSILEWSGTSPKAQQLAQKLDAAGQEIVTTIVCCEEQMRGWMSSLGKKQDLKDQIEAYRRLHRRLESYCRMRILDFDEPAAVKFQDLRKAKIRVGSMDLKIAAIALVYNATLMTENMRDFARVPGLRREDWEKL